MPQVYTESKISKNPTCRKVADEDSHSPPARSCEVNTGMEFGTYRPGRAASRFSIQHATMRIFVCLSHARCALSPNPPAFLPSPIKKSLKSDKLGLEICIGSLYSIFNQFNPNFNKLYFSPTIYKSCGTLFLKIIFWMPKTPMSLI